VYWSKTWIHYKGVGHAHLLLHEVCFVGFANLVMVSILNLTFANINMVTSVLHNIRISSVFKHGHVYTMSTNAPVHVVKDVLQDIMNIIKGIS